MDSTYRTNNKKLPLLHVVGSTALHKTFSGAFCFMKNEDVASYMIVVGYLRGMFNDDGLPFVFVVDCEDALIAALRQHFPSAAIFLCIWHIEKNLVKNCKAEFPEKEHWDAFLKHWNLVSYSLALVHLCQTGRLRNESSSRLFMQQLSANLKLHGIPSRKIMNYKATLFSTLPISGLLRTKKNLWLRGPTGSAISDMLLHHEGKVHTPA